MNSTPRILMVDDEPNILAGYRRSLARKFSIEIAEGAANALKLMSTSGPFQVVVTDMRMPEIDGIEFVKRARAQHKDTVYLMLTGNADQDTAVRAINEGQLFRFLNKPCPSDQLEQAVLAGLRQYELITAEKILLRDTVTGSIRLLMDILEMSNPMLAKLQKSVRATSRDIAGIIGFESGFDFDLASTICLLGFAVVGGNIDAQSITDSSLLACADSGSRLLAHIPRLEHVAGMICRQRYESKIQDPISSTDPIVREQNGAQILRIAVDFHRELLMLPNANTVIKRLRATPGKYDSRLLSAIEHLEIARSVQPRDTVRWTQIRLPSSSLEPGMVLADDLLSVDKKLLLSKDHELSAAAIERIHTLVGRGILDDEINVLVKSEAIQAA